MTESKPALPGASALAGNGSWLPTWMLAALLGLATMTLYWPVLHHDFVDFDDDAYVTANVQVQNGISEESIPWAFSNLVAGNWHPLTMLSHMLDCQLYGLRPWGHHLTSLGLHTCNSVLLFLLLWRLTGARWRSAMVGALFAWHPLHVESVAWVAERKDVLSTCFGLLALLAYAKYVQNAESRKQKAETGARFPASILHPLSSSAYCLSLSCFALSLLAKPMLVTLPFLLLLLDWWPLRRFELSTLNSQPSTLLRLVLEKWPFFLLAAGACMVTLAAQQRAGAVSSLATLPLGLRCDNALISYCRYLFKMFWPAELAVFYPMPARWPQGWVLLAGLFLGGLTVFFWLKRQRYLFLLVGWFWFVGTLVPVIGLVQVGAQAMADRYAYVPSVGLLLLLVWGVPELSRHWRQPAIGLSLAGSAALLLCAITTRQQLAYWQNGVTLFRHALKLTADNDTARNNLGVALFKAKQTNAAISEFQAAIHFNPACVEAHESLGHILGQQGETAAAISQYQAAIRLKPASMEARENFGNFLAQHGQTAAAIRQYQAALILNPNHAELRNNLGNVFVRQSRTNDAASQFQAAIRLKPDYAEAHNNLGNLFAMQGRTEAATSEFQAAIRCQPDYAEAHHNFGLLLAQNGQTDAAIRQLQEALRITPADAPVHYQLGNWLAKQGRTEEAITQFREVIRLAPAFASAHYHLGVALARQDQASEAITQFEETLRLKPDDAIAHDKLGIVLGDHGRLDEAISHFQAALRLKPDFAEASNNLVRAMEINRVQHNR